MRFLALAIIAMGCTSSEAPTPEGSVVMERHESWVQTLAEKPATFGDIVGSSRDAWIALHKADWPNTLSSAGDSTSLQFRGHAEMAGLYRRLASISRHSWAKTRKIWTERPEAQPDPALLPIPALATASGLLPAEALLVAEALPSAQREQAESTLSLSIESLLQRAQEDAIVVPGRKVHIQDPLVFQGLAMRHREALEALPAPTGPSAVLFSACAVSTRGPLAPEEFHPYRCTDSGLLSQAGLGFSDLGSDDAPQAARELARALDDHVLAWQRQLDSVIDKEGLQLLDDLQLLGIYRNRTLLNLAELALDSERPKQALALAQLAQNMESPREIGPLNPPLLFAILAEANVRTGRIREALEPLEVLARSFPETSGLDEAVGDLSVLNGMNRQGDSKEL